MTHREGTIPSADSQSEIRATMQRIAILEMMLQEHMEKYGPHYVQTMLLGESQGPPAKLLETIEEAKRDLSAMRLSKRVTRLLGLLEKLEDHVGAPSGSEETLTIQQAANILGVRRKTLQNRISEQKRRRGRDFRWVLRAGRTRGCVIDRKRFMAWLEQRPRQRGRPPGAA